MKPFLPIYSRDGTTPGPGEKQWTETSSVSQCPSLNDCAGHRHNDRLSPLGLLPMFPCSRKEGRRQELKFPYAAIKDLVCEYDSIRR